MPRPSGRRQLRRARPRRRARGVGRASTIRSRRSSPACARAPCGVASSRIAAARGSRLFEAAVARIATDARVRSSRSAVALDAAAVLVAWRASGVADAARRDARDRARRLRRGRRRRTAIARALGVDVRGRRRRARASSSRAPGGRRRSARRRSTTCTRCIASCSRRSRSRRRDADHRRRRRRRASRAPPRSRLRAASSRRSRARPVSTMRRRSSTPAVDRGDAARSAQAARSATTLRERARRARRSSRSARGWCRRSTAADPRALRGSNVARRASSALSRCGLDRDRRPRRLDDARSPRRAISRPGADVRHRRHRALRSAGDGVGASSCARCRARLAHRGPDGRGEAFALGFAALAHTRLAMVDRAGGAQPFGDGRYTIVYNGELYNHDGAARAAAGTVAHAARTPRPCSPRGARGARRASTRSTACSRSSSGTTLAAGRLRGARSPRRQAARLHALPTAASRSPPRRRRCCPVLGGRARIATAIVEYLVAPAFSGRRALAVRGRSTTCRPVTCCASIARRHHARAATGAGTRVADGRSRPDELRAAFERRGRARARARTCRSASSSSGGLDSTAIAARRAPQLGALPAFTIAFADGRLGWRRLAPRDLRRRAVRTRSRRASSASQHHEVAVDRATLAAELAAVARVNDALPAWEQELVAARARPRRVGARQGRAGRRRRRRDALRLSLPARRPGSPRSSSSASARCRSAAMSIRDPVARLDAEYRALAGETRRRSRGITRLIVERWLPRLLHNGDIHCMAFGLEARVPFAATRLLELAARVGPRARRREKARAARGAARRGARGDPHAARSRRCRRIKRRARSIAPSSRGIARDPHPLVRELVDLDALAPLVGRSTTSARVRGCSASIGLHHWAVAHGCRDAGPRRHAARERALPSAARAGGRARAARPRRGGRGDRDIGDELAAAGVRTRVAIPPGAPPPATDAARCRARRGAPRSGRARRLDPRRCSSTHRAAGVAPLRAILRDVRPDVVAIDTMAYDARDRRRARGHPVGRLGDLAEPVSSHSTPCVDSSALIRTLRALDPASPRAVRRARARGARSGSPTCCRRAAPRCSRPRRSSAPARVRGVTLVGAVAAAARVRGDARRSARSPTAGRSSTSSFGSQAWYQPARFARLVEAARRARPRA